jgi:RNA polymerase sigma-B factor
LSFDRACPENLDGDRDRMIVDHLPLARSLALRYRNRGVPVEDLVQVANLALVKAARRYRSSLGQSFAAYAAPTITGELRRHFRDHGWDVRPPRRLQELKAKLSSAEDDLAQALGRHPTTDELAERLEVSAEEVDATQCAARGYRSVPLDDLTGGSDSLGGGEEAFDDVLSSQTVGSLLDHLSARERRIIALRYFGDATQAEIGREIGVTQMQVSRLLSRILGTLREELQAG